MNEQLSFEFEIPAFISVRMSFHIMEISLFSTL